MLVCESHSSHLGSVCGLFLTSSMTFLSIFKIVSTSLFYETTCFDQNSRVSPVCYFFFLPFFFSSSLSRLHFTSLYFSCLSCFSFVASYVCHFDKSIYVDPNKYACFFFSHHYYHLAKSIFIHWNSLSLNNIYVQSFILQARFKMTFLGEQPFVVSEEQLPNERFDDQ
jgi:hypothetical protein